MADAVTHALLDYQDLGIGIIALAVVYQFSKWLTNKAFEEIKRSHDVVIETNKRMTDFIENSYSDNTKAINEMINILKDHIKAKDEIVELLKDQLTRQR